MWCRFSVLVYVKDNETVNSNLMPNKITEEETKISVSVINLNDVVRYYKSYDVLDGVEVDGTCVRLNNEDFLFLLISEKEFTSLFQKARGVKVINYVK